MEMGNSNSFSYHVTMDDIFYWPMSSFGQYCTSESSAVKEFEKLKKENPRRIYKVVKYPTVVERGEILGITGNPVTICTSETDEESETMRKLRQQ